ncbi:winged helix-turn-helix domain-containing protein [Micromonospora sp. NBC_01796]|uniref:winged helix-turn-helix domain-containing protein n=1 Tax=Micromonospora sp. NBC_01796 TaxID=2975987 RepID=UPI002DD99D35|nr:winged helix-turn-helix domain-containing protein [Micromonospora sp. NBC_01796]WSA89527.1 winged helix-turn-helix domain-containing protein [Micromonospora sp. NBC_01796]
MGVVLKDARRSVTSWCRRHTIGGDGAVAARRGQRSGPAEALSRDQELELIDALRGRYPDQFGFDDPLWTRQSVTALVERQFGLTIEPATVGEYLHAWGLGPREPTDRACGLCVDAVRIWMRQEYPGIVRSAQEHRAELCWLGRTRLHGVAPAADVISAMSQRGRMKFMITTPTVDPPLPRDFLLRLSGVDGRLVHVVVDGSWGRGEWPRRLPPRIAPYALPSCGRS